MAEERKNRIPNGVTKTLLCVDACENSDYSGTLYNLYLPEPIPFSQVKDIITVLEDFFDTIAYPQSYFEQRTFLGLHGEEPHDAAIPERHLGEDVFSHRGSLATFMVEVSQRQNATWQGNACWMEQNIHSAFQSTLELLKLMDSAIAQGVFSA